MTNPWQRYHPPAKPKPGDIASAMRAFAPDAASTARVEALTEGWTQPESHKGRAGNRSRIKGNEAEGIARRELRAAGWHINSGMAGSFGAADIEAHRTLDVAADNCPGIATRLIQIKRLAEFVPSGLNDAVARFLGLGKWDEQAPPRLTPAHQREAWLWVDYRGWVAQLVVWPDGTVTGDGPLAEEAIAGIERMIERQRAQRNRTTSPQSFQERLNA